VQTTGRKQHIRVTDLPEDMQQLLTDMVEGDLGTEALRQLYEHQFTVSHIPLSWFPHAGLDTRERGAQYARDMIGQDLPPILLCGRKWVDGRHRVWALRRSGCTRVVCINTAEIGCTFPFPHLGVLRDTARRSITRRPTKKAMPG
jgi:hypothetical protein